VIIPIYIPNPGKKGDLSPDSNIIKLLTTVVDSPIKYKTLTKEAGPTFQMEQLDWMSMSSRYVPWHCSL